MNNSKKVSSFLLILVFIAFLIIMYVVGSLKIFFPIAVVAACLFLSTMVITKNPSAKANRAFFVLGLLVSLWSFGIFVSVENVDLGFIFLISKINSLIITIMPLSFVYFCYFFPKEEKTPSIKEKILWFLPVVVFFLFINMNYIVTGAEKVNNRNILSYGPLFLPWSIFLLSFFIYGFYILFKKHQISSGLSKIQIRYIFLAFISGVIPPVLTNLILPLFGVASLRWLAPIFPIVAIAIMTIAILKHNLLSIEIVIQKGFIYTVASALIIGSYTLIVIISESFLRSTLGYSSNIVTALFVFLVAATFQPLIQFLQKFTDKIFFRHKYDYQRTLRGLSREILTKIKLEEVVKLVGSAFSDIMRVSEIAFLMLDKDGQAFCPAGNCFDPKMRIAKNSKLVSYLNRVKNILVIEELPAAIARHESLPKTVIHQTDLLKEVLSEVGTYRFVLWVPVILRDEVIAIIALGEKKSQDVYNDEDLRLLNTIANQTALALDNARLYSAVLDVKNYNQEILDSLWYGIMTTDQSGKIKTFNPAMEKITERQAKEIAGKHYLDVFPEKSPIADLIKKTLDLHTAQNSEANLISKKRGMIPVLISTSIMYDSHSQKYGVLLSIRDLSSRKELEYKVRQADKLKALGTMSAGMAHEIKNPLSSLRLMTQMLPLKYDDPEFRQKMLEIFPVEISRIDRIVEDLLQFAKNTEMKMEKLDLNQMINKVLDDYRGQAKNNKIVIKKALEQFSKITADRNQLKQVFSNLILNAIQAMPEGGTVTINNDQLTINNEGFIRISIRDTGHGIAEENIKNLFDPFFTTKYKGSGLGLTITHTIIESHKGEIRVESKLGEGTTFEVYLPVEQ
ncbi:ATP-binding protein [Candidatus Margulisiibacteriota bacterium]